MSAMPTGLSREDWLAALPRAMVAGFVKTNKEECLVVNLWW